LLCPVKEWYGHQTIGALYRTIYRAVASRAGVPLSAVTPHGYRLVPDSQPYVDPTKDIQAALMAIEGGLSTYEHEIGKRGEDYRQVMEQQAVEKALLESHGLHPRFKGDEVITEHDEQGGNDA
jgi:capsid protein